MVLLRNQIFWEIQHIFLNLDSPIETANLKQTIFDQVHWFPSNK